MDHWMNEWMHEVGGLMKKAADGWLNEWKTWMSEKVNDWMDEWKKDSMNE